MTPTPSLEDTIATLLGADMDVLAEAHSWMALNCSEEGHQCTPAGHLIRDLKDYAQRLAEVLRAAGVVPAEPAPPPWPKFCPMCLAEFHADGTVTPGESVVPFEPTSPGRCAFCGTTAEDCRKRAPAYCCAECIHPEAASVTPPEPAGHDTPLFEGTMLDMEDWVHSWDSVDALKRVVVYAAAVTKPSGEAPAT